MSYDFLDGQSVLVTGGTGSFGQRCVKTLLEKSRAKKIIIFSRDELKQSQMNSAFDNSEGRLRYFIGDVRDLPRLERAFYEVDYVIHAAALKQVPAIEYNPFEAIKTNIIGSQNVIDAAINQGVKKVVLLSSDKAANPANLYGATKLCAEKLFVNGNVYSAKKTCFAAVRYGNVFGSRGSILKVIEEQRSTGEITLTHEEMTRFWITLDQGIDLVLMALDTMHGGEVYIPKIPSMKVLDLIKAIAPECAIKTVGIRPGEKLHEMLVTPEESRHAREFDNHYVILPENNSSIAEKYDTGSRLADGFYLTSQTNTVWFNEESLKKMIKLL